jgi:uncharacterized protein YneF (UPF0154 family)
MMVVMMLVVLVMFVTHFSGFLIGMYTAQKQVNAEIGN